MATLLEPIENLYLEVPNENLGDVLQSLAARKGEIVSMDHHADARLSRSDYPDARLDWIRERSC